MVAIYKTGLSVSLHVLNILKSLHYFIYDNKNCNQQWIWKTKLNYICTNLWLHIFDPFPDPTTGVTFKLTRVNNISTIQYQINISFLMVFLACNKLIVFWKRYATWSKLSFKKYMAAVLITPIMLNTITLLQLQ